LETGQPAFAFAAIDWNAAWSMPGIFAVTVRWTEVMGVADPKRFIVLYSFRVVHATQLMSASAPAGGTGRLRQCHQRVLRWDDVLRTNVLNAGAPQLNVTAVKIASPTPPLVSSRLDHVDRAAVPSVFDGKRYNAADAYELRYKLISDNMSRYVSLR